jgi:hypothetical protein
MRRGITGIAQELTEELRKAGIPDDVNVAGLSKESGFSPAYGGCQSTLVQRLQGQMTQQGLGIRDTILLTRALVIPASPDNAFDAALGL